MTRKNHLWILFIFFIIVLCCMCSTAFGAESPQLTLSLSPDEGTDCLAEIAWYHLKGNQYYLFLPASYDLNRAILKITGISDLTVNGKKASDGDSASILKVGENQVKLGNKSAKIIVMRGSENLPALFITTDSGKLNYIHASKDHKEPGTLLFIGPDGMVQYDGTLSHIKTRGNSSLTFKKKNYQIKLETGTSLMKMGKAKKWILTGNYRDKSFLRNQIMYDLAERIGLPYTPEHIPAELYINGEYLGLYLFSEKVEIDDDRIAIHDLEAETEDLNGGDVTAFERLGSREVIKGKYKAFDIPNEPEDITGGYLIEYESYPTRYRQEVSAYTSKKGNILVVKSPEYVSVNQMAYITNLLQCFENAIFAPDGIDPSSGKHYTDLMDLNSLVLKYMVEEFCKNYDGNSSSQYFYKPEDSFSEKLFAGPVWDYDSSFGSYAQKYNAKKVLSGTGLWIASNDKSQWWPQLYRREDFRQEVRYMWNARMREAVEILLGKLPGDELYALKSIDEYAKAIVDSADMDYVRWPRLKTPSTIAQTGGTFKQNIAFLKEFIQIRYDYLNKEWAE